ncbi:MAG: DUF5618 family protein [Fibromonadaceae bacterium]|jgi:hypothetical protein|nr:DUF5618 family protein [Fibromonadaceae bacterium]
MTIQEQQHIKQKGYAEAVRYIANAKDVLQKAGFKDGRYADSKYVRMACGTAYSGVLIAIEAWLKLKGVDFSEIAKNKNKRKNIEFYKNNVASLDGKLKGYLDDAYQVLHLDGYYDGLQNIKVIKEGFVAAKYIAEQIKPVGAAQ